MGVIVAGVLYIAQGSNPESDWKALSPTATSRPAGFGVYADGAYTVEYPLVVTENSTVNLTNNAATMNEDYLPSDGTLYELGRVMGNTLGSTLDLRVSFFAKASLANGGFTLSLDISAAGDGSTTVASHAVRMLKGSGIYEQYSVTFNLFALETFISNGGQVRFEADNGNITMHSLSYFIKK